MGLLFGVTCGVVSLGLRYRDLVSAVLADFAVVGVAFVGFVAFQILGFSMFCLVSVFYGGFAVD